MRGLVSFLFGFIFAFVMQKALIIEDDAVFAGILKNFLDKRGYSSVTESQLKSARAAVLTSPPDLILLDINLPDGNGLDLLEFIRQENVPVGKVIIMTSFNDVRTAVKALKSGAHDYITKPINPEELLMVIGETDSEGSSSPSSRQSGQGGMIIGTAELAREMLTHIHLVAPTQLTVLLEGKSGTGKEEAARCIHELSSRSAMPFVAVDCGVLNNETANSELFGHVKGAFTGAVQDKVGHLVQAHGGTLFLDEIGNLNYEVQVKLLRVLQERVVQPMGSQKTRKIDIRIIAATNEDLKHAMAKGEFREDLYHRLNEFKINVPSLVDRLEDLPLFVDRFILHANRDLNRSVKKVSREVMELFKGYDWPGNIRELKSLVRRAVLLCSGDTIELDQLPAEMIQSGNAVQVDDSSPSDLKSLKSQLERELLIKTLKKTNYNKSQAARLLKIDRTTLYNKLAEYKIHPGMD